VRADCPLGRSAITHVLIQSSALAAVYPDIAEIDLLIARGDTMRPARAILGALQRINLPV